MDNVVSPPPPSTEQHGTAQKRKRSASPSHASNPTPPPPAKASRTTNSSHLHINYLARQYAEILPLIATDDTLPALLALISDYDGVLQRHESMAGNLGARPLGPMLISRFERLFDGPPRVLKSHGKEGTQISWLDVVEFARNKPEQFNLEKMRDGVRVCQFYTKQCRVEISEEDFELLRSGVPQKMIPPQPIGEDEEKELGTLEILEKNVGSVVQLADQVSARARQLNHRLKMRRGAIVQRREAEAAERREDEGDARSPDLRGSEGATGSRASMSPTSGFTAVNLRPSGLSNGQAGRPEGSPRASLSANGASNYGASAATRAELLSKFRTSSEREALQDSADGSRLGTLQYNSHHSSSRPSLPPKSRSKHSAYVDDLSYPNNLIAASQSANNASATASGTAVPIPNTPSSLLPQSSKAAAAADSREDSGLYKADMMQRMEQLNRADRVQPPCDRCRRLHMDCLKNLTACIGCTKKHAKCSWKDVTAQELKDHPFVARVVVEGTSGGGGSGRSGSEDDGTDAQRARKERDWSAEAKARREVRDEELLGEESDEDDDDDDDDDEEEEEGEEAMTRDAGQSAAEDKEEGSLEAATHSDTVMGESEEQVNGTMADENAAPTTNGHRDCAVTVNGEPAAPTMDDQTPVVANGGDGAAGSTRDDALASTTKDHLPLSPDEIRTLQASSLVAEMMQKRQAEREAEEVGGGALKVYTAGRGSAAGQMEEDGGEERGRGRGKEREGSGEGSSSRPGSRGGMKWDEETGKMRLET